MAYPTHVAAALSGASTRQLQYWRQAHGHAPLLEPEVRSGSRIFYSFRDVIALRTFVYLREEISLQRIRRAVKALRELGNTDHLSEYRLCANGNSVIWVDGNQDLVDLVKNPGQYVMKVAMRDLLDSFTNRQGDEVVPLLQPRQRLEVNPGIRGGYPVVTGTRIPYDLIAGLVADGLPESDIAYFYPSVDAAAAADAFDFYKYVESLRDNEVSSAAQ